MVWKFGLIFVVNILIPVKLKTLDSFSGLRSAS